MNHTVPFRKGAGLGLLLALAAALPLPGQQIRARSAQAGDITHEGRAWVQVLHYEVKTRPGQTLRFRSDLGSVRILTGDGNTVKGRLVAKVYTRDEARARAFFRRLGVQAQTTADGVLIRGSIENVARSRRMRGRSLKLDYEVTVPRRYNLDIETQAGGIEIVPLDGTVQAVTAGGGITVGDVTGRVMVHTAGGHIRLANVGDRLEARTAGGHIRVGDVNGDANLETSGGHITGGRVEGRVIAQTAGGNIVLRSVAGSVEAQTAGGQISVGESGGTVQAQTAGGSVRVYGSRGMVDVETAGGSIDLLDLDGGVRALTHAGSILVLIRASQKTFSASQLETSMGNVKVYLPATLALTIEAEIDDAFGHKIRSDFPLQIQRNGRDKYGTVRGSGPINGGGKVLKIRTTMGNIQIIKITKKVLADMEKKKVRWRQRVVRDIQREIAREERRKKRRKDKDKNKDKEDEDDEHDDH